MWNPFKRRSYKIDFGTMKVHVRPCKLSESFKNIYPTGLSLYNIILSQRVDYGVTEVLRDVDGVAQIIPNIGAYNIIIEIPSTFDARTVISMCVLAVHTHYTNPKKNTSFSTEKAVIQ